LRLPSSSYQHRHQTRHLRVSDPASTESDFSCKLSLVKLYLHFALNSDLFYKYFKLQARCSPLAARVRSQIGLESKLPLHWEPSLTRAMSQRESRKKPSLSRLGHHDSIADRVGASRIEST
jgi:hypothetical protein